MKLAFYDFLLAIVCIGGSASAARIWRNPPGDRPKGFPSEPPSVWFGDGATWRAAVRSLHCVVAFLSVLTILGIARLTLDESEARVVTMTIGIPMFCGIAALGLSISLFSWPRRAVPPALRAESGIFTEWRGRGRSKSPST